jgi:superoxide dismutase
VSEYTLPDLPYDYAALEPHIAGEIMQLHHDKHHATYVAGANTALEKMAEARETGTWLLSTCWRRTSPSTSAVTSTTRSSG